MQKVFIFSKATSLKQTLSIVHFRTLSNHLSKTSHCKSLRQQINGEIEILKCFSEDVTFFRFTLISPSSVVPEGRDLTTSSAVILQFDGNALHRSKARGDIPVNTCRPISASFFQLKKLHVRHQQASSNTSSNSNNV